MKMPPQNSFIGWIRFIGWLNLVCAIFISVLLLANLPKTNPLLENSGYYVNNNGNIGIAVALIISSVIFLIILEAIARLLEKQNIIKELLVRQLIKSNQDGEIK
jgi:hypothetical protein